MCKGADRCVKGLTDVVLVLFLLYVCCCCFNFWFCYMVKREILKCSYKSCHCLKGNRGSSLLFLKIPVVLIQETPILGIWSP